MSSLRTAQERIRELEAGRDALSDIVVAYLDAYGCIDSACHAPGIVGHADNCYLTAHINKREE